MDNSWIALTELLKKSKTVFNHLNLEQTKEISISLGILRDTQDIEDFPIATMIEKIEVLTYLVIALLEMKETEYNAD